MVMSAMAGMGMVSGGVRCAEMRVVRGPLGRLYGSDNRGEEEEEEDERGRVGGWLLRLVSLEGRDDGDGEEDAGWGRV